MCWKVTVLATGLLESRGYQSMIILGTQKLADTEVQNIFIPKKSRILYPKFNIKSR